MNRVLLFISLLITICLSQTITTPPITTPPFNTTLPPLSELEYQQQFTDFLVKYNKSYTNVEFTQRFLIFKDTLNYILNFNSLTGNDTDAMKLGINQFADITEEEFYNIYLNKFIGTNETTTSSTSTTSTSPMSSASSTTGSGSGGLLTGVLGGTTGGLLGNLLGTTVNVLTGIGSKDENENINTVQSRNLHEVSAVSDVDWRYLTPTVKDQGQCGSCYAFSVIGAIEAAVKLNRGNIVTLSEQQIIDCTKSNGNYGCDGGFVLNTFMYIYSNGGVNTDSVYQYEGRLGRCRYNENKYKEKITGYGKVRNSDQNLELSLKIYGPISVTINANPRSFMMYQSGIYDDPQCTSDSLNHAVLAVGMKNENGKPYYIVKNSWGTGWGEGGYFRMIRGKNMCGIVNYGLYPRASS